MRLRARGPMVALLAILAAHHLCKGFYFLVVQNPAAAIADLRNREVENAYFLDHISPLSQQFLAIQGDDSGRWSQGADRARAHGVETANGALPPWTYPLQLALFLPGPEQVARVYLAGLDVVALLVIAWTAFCRVSGPDYDRTATVLVVLSPLAIGATNSSLTQGQSSLVVNAALALVLATLVQRVAPARSTRGGLAFAVAMTKPSSALLFAIAIIGRRRLLMLATCACVLAASTIGASLWLHHSIPFQFEQFDRLSRRVVEEGANPLLNRLAAASSAGIASRAFALAGVVVALGVARALRQASVFTLFAALSAISRVFTYHRAYDDVLLAFLVIELAARAWAPGSSRRSQAAWALAGATLWLPYSAYLTDAAQVFQIAIWCGLVGFLIVEEWCERGDSNPHGC